MEEWKTIDGYDGLYEVSNMGRVKSLSSGRWNKVLILSPYDNSNGYKRVTLVNGGRKYLYVHRLVAEAFLGKSDLIVNHKNGNRSDNRVTNLEYVSNRENINHSKRGRFLKGVGISKGRFRANALYMGKNVFLGVHESEQKAHEAYVNFTTKIQENKYADSRAIAKGM